MQNNSKRFFEVQKFEIRWLAVTVAILEPLSIFAVLYMFLNNGYFPLIIILTLLPAILFRIIINIKFETYIDENEIRYRWVPLQRTFYRIPLDSIITTEIIKFKKLRYGSRTHNKYGHTHIVKGNEGLLINMKNNLKIMIGTQKSEELIRALN